MTKSEPIVEELAAGAEAEWDAFVCAHPESSHYQRAGWSEVVRRAFGHETLRRVARQGGAIVGVLPIVRFANPLFGRYLVSMPYLNRGGILASSPEAAGVLLAEGRRLVAGTRSKSLELRHVHPIDATLPRRDQKVSMALDLTPGADALWEGVGPKVRNLIRKAEKAGLSARVADPHRDFSAFYELFAENMRDLGTPVYSARFFQEVLRVFPDSTRLSLVERGDSPAAAALCVSHGSFTEIHWAASRRSMLSFSPNMLLYWEAISWAVRAELSTFCFGRSTLDSGPYHFKKQWGAVATPLSWEYVLAPGASVPKINPDNPKYRAAVSAWKKLPLSLSKVLGPPVVRHIP